MKKHLSSLAAVLSGITLMVSMLAPERCPDLLEDKYGIARRRLTWPNIRFSITSRSFS
jgi:hypothetical protein